MEKNKRLRKNSLANLEKNEHLDEAAKDYFKQKINTAGKKGLQDYLENLILKLVTPVINTFDKANSKHGNGNKKN